MRAESYTDPGELVAEHTGLKHKEAENISQPGQQQICTVGGEVQGVQLLTLKAREEMEEEFMQNGPGNANK